MDFATLSNTTMRLDYVRGAELVHKLVWNQVNDAGIWNTIQCKPESREGNQPFALVGGQRKTVQLL